MKRNLKGYNNIGTMSIWAILILRFGAGDVILTNNESEEREKPET